jgi:SAM-dependent MidA family methyltransferase
MPPTAELPPPNDAARATSTALESLIGAEIRARGGWIDFARYMELALYAPGLGYYSGGSTKLGASGDFVTAPELSDVLGRALAQLLAADCVGIEAPLIVEVGAGSGKLAAQILDALAARGRSDVRYAILERSADLAERQRCALARFGARVTWLTQLPREPVASAVLANEVVDALPVERFVKRAGRTRPLGVVASGGRFAWREGPESASLDAAVEQLECKLGGALPNGFTSEICLLLPVWIGDLAACLRQGSCILIDYGSSRREYYHAERGAGTLICHYRHRAHTDPFLYPGLCDISAWVDFSACADAAAAAGLSVDGYTTQGQFLLETLAVDPPLPATDARSTQALAALKTLLLPGEMGERFKVLLFRKDLAGRALPGRDFRDRL